MRALNAEHRWKAFFFKETFDLGGVWCYARSNVEAGQGKCVINVRVLSRIS
jgi:hypothetical protein